MSFDKKIREKLANHIPEYDSGAWNNFQKMLPAPWYMKIFQSSAGWILGGLSTTALLFTIYYNYTKTTLLNDEITTLKNQIENTVSVQNEERSTVAQIDTVFITREIENPQATENSNRLAYRAGIQDAQAISKKDMAYLQNELAALRQEKLANSIERDLKSVETAPSKQIVKANSASTEGTSANAGFEKEPDLETFIAQNQATQKASDIDKSKDPSVSKNDNEEEGQSESDRTGDSATKAKIDAIPAEDILVSDAKNTTDSQESISQTKPNLSKDGVAKEDAPMEILELKAPEEEVTRTDPEKPKKKLKLPLMRFGVNTDYLGLKVLATGPTIEVFLGDKLSFNASALFSNQITTRHSFTRDFNNKTGKRFEEEFKRFVSQRPEIIQDISIKTSFVKLPLYFNYYINTWSRFNFIISGGTKLDLSVYQDVDYFTGPLNQRLKSRFEARPKAKVFNNLYYGMGMQYKYGSFVGQLTPYFDFAFREPDYFTPARRFGINAALKFEFGN